MSPCHTQCNTPGLFITVDKVWMVRLVCCEDGCHFIVVCWMDVFVNAVSRQLYLFKWTFISELWHIRPGGPEEVTLSLSNQPATGPSGPMPFLICTLFSHLEQPQKWSHLMSERKNEKSVIILHTNKRLTIVLIWLKSTLLSWVKFHETLFCD